MKNKEKFAKEIIEIALKYCHFGMDKNGEICPCCELACELCMFNVEGGCNSATIEWANSEYKEKKVFSEADKALVKGLDKLNWFARDKNGDVWGFVDRPSKRAKCWYTNDGMVFWIYRFSSVTFEPLSWEDKEPTHRSEILGE